MGTTEPIPLRNGRLGRGGRGRQSKRWRKTQAHTSSWDGNESGHEVLFFKPPITRKQFYNFLCFPKQHIQNASKRTPNYLQNPELTDISYCWDSKIQGALFPSQKGKYSDSWSQHITLLKNAKACEQGNVWHRFIYLQLQWKIRTLFKCHFIARVLVSAPIDTHTDSMLCFSFCRLVGFESAAIDQYRIAVNQIKENRRPSSFQMVILSDCLNIKFILICNPK